MDQELVKKIQSAVLDMMSKVVMNKQHRYQRILDKAWLQGASTISSIIPKNWLSAWGGKEAIKALGWYDRKIKGVPIEEENTLKEKAATILAEIGQIHSDQRLDKYLNLLENAKGASKRKSKAAMIDGKVGHEWLEEYVKAKIRNKDIPIIPESNLKRPLTQFIEWAEREVDYWILSEARVAFPDKGYAGTLDALAMMKTGKLAIIDFKFATHIDEEYYLQTAGYQHTFDQYDIKIDQRIIIRLPKTLEVDIWNKEYFHYFRVPDNIEVRIVPTPYELDRDAFLAALIVKKWINFCEPDY